MKHIIFIAIFVSAIFMLSTLDDRQEKTEQSVVVDKVFTDEKKVVESFFKENPSFITYTESKTAIFKRKIDKKNFALPFYTSTAEIEVTYSLEYSVGYEFQNVTIREDENNIYLTLDNPKILNRPAVHLLNYQVKDGGFLIDESLEVANLQQEITKQKVDEPIKIVYSENVLRKFLKTFVKKEIHILYRK